MPHIRWKRGPPQLYALAYNLGNFMRTLAQPWSLTSLEEKLIKIGAKVSHARPVTCQMAEVAVPRQMFA